MVEDAVTESTSAVEQAVQQRIQAARIRVAASQQRRDELSAARRRGLAARHANRLRNLAEQAQRAQQHQDDDETAPKENHMSKRALSHTAATGAAPLAAEIAEHSYAILQTRIERVPTCYRQSLCGQPGGCGSPATLVTFAVSEVTDEPDDLGLIYARDDGQIIYFPVCDEHRSEATHELYWHLTGIERPDGIRAYDIPGAHLGWT
ncbi:hypothetical protein OG342_08875 [Streptomyces bobili]|uniref:hypothetical protein n=1 Tax=Streptomyces bobili TaxID=67280 RepID=UPI00225665FB|nr:hypothetical protein [Streptomyces bobili]MCX5522973.1 hypothetical protein [Streptomyces bobili]